ncbi:hypothetical protein ZIOFF_035486 [Zingiber officinale]|uniref:Retroviral polymerase SH3-like domain-containing protein n=1 Tax=Zingiber officinale TaxID=94328 RepID=A0A8J5G8Y2_ZINOF|nr:hypothetical protein ZIOFF_035486 [Zingiber officinale]
MLARGELSMVDWRDPGHHSSTRLASHEGLVMGDWWRYEAMTSRKKANHSCEHHEKNHQEEILNEEGLLHGEEEVVVLLTPIGTLKIRMTEMKDMDMEEAVVEAEVKVVDEVETLDGDITPEEAWSLHKPKVDHLRIFGSLAYAKVQEEKQTKLEDKSQKCILLSYCKNANGYKCYNSITQKLVVSKDLEFDEEQAWNWNNNNNDDMK